MVLSPHGGMVYTRNLKFLAVRLTGSSPVGDTIMQNEHIEYFKRYSSCYLMWVNSNFDRIASDAVKRQEMIKAEQDKFKRNNTPSMIKLREMFRVTNEMAKKWLIKDARYNEAIFGPEWPTTMHVGTTLKIRLPDGSVKNVKEPSFLSRVLSFLPPLMKGTPNEHASPSSVANRQAGSS